MNPIHAGGCLCGATRYSVTGVPIRTQVCHCKFCQRRTGSSFSVVVAFKEDKVQIRGEALTVFEHRSDESQRWLRYGFCARCGTNVVLTVERDPSLRIVFGGTFDDPNWLKVDRHIWTRSANHWTTFPLGAELHEKGYSAAQNDRNHPPKS